MEYKLNDYPVIITNETIPWDNCNISQITYTTALPNGAVLDVSLSSFY